MPAWNQIQCKAWLLRRGLQKGNEHEVKKTVAINDMNATRAKPGLQRRFSVDGSNQSGRPKAFELQKNVDGEMVPVCGPEFAAILTKRTGIKPDHCTMDADQRLGVQACDLLNQLGKYVEGRNPGVKWVLGPIKGLGRMSQKASQQIDYDFDFSGLKDCFRGSIACPDRYFVGARNTLNECIQPEYGMSLKEPVKDKFQERDKFMGYGDLTYFVVFRELHVSCELQVHKLGMLFGKMSKASWVKCELEPLMSYEQKERELGIPGGLGHLFLEVATRGGYSEAAVKAAKELSPLYYAACNASGPATTNIRTKIAEFKILQQEHVVVRTTPAM